MRKFGIILIGVIVLVLGFVLLGPNKTVPNGEPSKNISNTMTVTSSFENNGKIPQKYTCDGENINPPLTISGVPEGAKSLALIMDDPDALRGTFTHWTMWNMKPVAWEIREDFKPMQGGGLILNPDTGETFPAEIPAEGKNSAGKIGYMGPCPPPGTPHRYFFKVYALDFPEFPDFETPPTKEDLEGFMQGHIIDQAELIGIYGR